MATVESRLEHPRLRMLAHQPEDKPQHERFTDEALARRLARSDKPFIPRGIYFNTQASRDQIRHFVRGMGDTNPLFTDPEYAKKSKYGRIIAPGTYLYTVLWGVPGRGGPGIHGWYSGGTWEWYRPIFEGDELSPVCVLREFVEKQGRMGGGRTWIDYADAIYVNNRGEIVGKERCYSIMAERAAAGSAKKYRDTPRPRYSREDWERFLALYAKEVEDRRGATPRYWEEVEVGEQLGPMIRGPLRTGDMIAWLEGAGSPFIQAHGIQFAWEARHPRGLQYVPETGDADVPEMVHILDAFARTVGVERAYDYGNQRQSWLGNLLTNWMGDDGFLWKMTGDLRVFNQIGDVTIFEGKVTRKYMDGDKCCVDIEAWAKNQRGEVSMRPNPATIILPSRQHGPVVYPTASPKLYQEVASARPLEELLAQGGV